ncbi:MULTISPECIES: YoaK family protein [unclassified Pseudonocardia]|uniref:YoaK family protein n=1 Tax=unclassified Pseudonocardia TaxID=2619320 RepID=UPI00094ADC33|nr:MULTISPECIES: YoaK family protein [unclassified Pseudonocardia]
MNGFDLPERAPRLLGVVTILLAATAGSLDAVTFFAFDGVFAGAMTGNFVHLGLVLGHGNWAAVSSPMCALGGYVIGLGLGTVVVGLALRRLPWRHAVCVALAGEFLALALALALALVLVLVGLGWWTLSSLGHQPLHVAVLVSGGALAMGLQAAAFRHVGPIGTPTNYMTGVVTNWVSSMVDVDRPRWDGNAGLRILTVVAGAAVGALVHGVAPALAYLLPVVMVAAAVLAMAGVAHTDHRSRTGDGSDARHPACRAAAGVAPLPVCEGRGNGRSRPHQLSGERTGYPK